MTDFQADMLIIAIFWIIGLWLAVRASGLDLSSLRAERRVRIIVIISTLTFCTFTCAMTWLCRQH